MFREREWSVHPFLKSQTLSRRLLQVEKAQPHNRDGNTTKHLIDTQRLKTPEIGTKHCMWPKQLLCWTGQTTISGLSPP